MDLFWLSCKCPRKLWDRLEVYLFDEASCERITRRSRLPRNISLRGSLPEGGRNVLRIHRRLVVRKRLRINYEARCLNSECVLDDSRGGKGVEKLRIRFSAGDGCRFRLGKGSSVGDVNVFLGENSQLLIGDDCMFSWEIVMRMTDAHTVLDSQTGEIVNRQTSPCVIGNHCWIGLRSVVMKNASLSDNSIVGAGSIVTARFDEPFTAIAGSPARVVKRGVTWDRRKIHDYQRETR